MLQVKPIDARSALDDSEQPSFDVADRRRLVHRAAAFWVEDSALSHARPLGHTYSSETQFVFPYFGAFGWRVGSERRLVDANAVLLVHGGQECHETHPVRGIGHGSAILTPGEGMLDELRAQSRRSGQNLAATVTHSMSDRAKLLTHAIVFGNDNDPLAIEERAMQLMFEAMRITVGAEPHAPSRTIEKAKEILHSRYFEPLSLERVAREVGVTPVYLTQAFRKSQGVPLYRYQTRLRLSRALVELPRCENITGLALDLGFSSHSHFTTVFRTMFGMTPSDFRADHGPRPTAVSASRQSAAAAYGGGRGSEAWAKA
jgi:AraC-like DNA-binding protein